MIDRKPKIYIAKNGTKWDLNKHVPELDEDPTKGSHRIKGTTQFLGPPIDAKYLKKDKPTTNQNKFIESRNILNKYDKDSLYYKKSLEDIKRMINLHKEENQDYGDKHLFLEISQLHQNKISQNDT
jgi:hypothetical protein